MSPTTHTVNMSPASYFTGMEICTVLSFRVEASSSLSLWGKRKNKCVMFQCTVCQL